MTRRLALLAVMALSCAAPIPEGRFRCSEDADCPDGFVCRISAAAEGRCFSTPGDSDAGVADAGVADAGMDAGVLDSGPDGGPTPPDASDVRCDEMHPCLPDGIECTAAPMCVMGVCVYPPATGPCNDLDACTQDEVCIPTEPPTCGNGTRTVCPDVDFDSCTSTRCVSPTGCETVFAPVGTPCDDGIFCNGADSCGETGCIAHTGDPCASMGRPCVEDADGCLACGMRDQACCAGTCDLGLFCVGAICRQCRTTADCPFSFELCVDNDCVPM